MMKNKIREQLSKNSKYLLLGCYICVYVLPYILKSIFMKTSGHALSEVVAAFCENFSNLTALCFVMCFFAFYFIGQFPEGWNQEKKKQLFYAFIKYSLYKEIAKWLVWPMLTGGLFATAFQWWLGILIIILEIAFLAGVLLKAFWEIVIELHVENNISGEYLKKLGICRGFFSKKKKFPIKLFWLTIGIWMIENWGGILGSLFFNLFFEIVEPAFVSRLFSKILIALFMTILIDKYMKKVRVAFSENIFTEEEGTNSEKGTIKTISNKKIVIVTSILAGIWGINMILGGFYEKEDILEKVDNTMIAAEEEVSNGNPVEGIDLYLKAENYIVALEEYLNGDYEKIYEFMNRYPKDEFYMQLYFSEKDNIAQLENYAKSLQISVNGMFRLLDVYAQMETLEEEQIQLREDFVEVCISREWFSTKNRWMEEGDLKRNKIEDTIDKYKHRLFYNEVLVWLQQAVRDAGVSYEKSKEVLSIAEKNKDNMVYQLVALIFGSQNVSKVDISYVTKLKKAAERFDNLYEQQLTEEADTQSILKEKMFVAGVLVQCLDYEGALSVLNSADKYGETEELIEYKMFCLKSLGRFEELEQYADSLDSENINEIAAYYSAIAYLKQGNVLESLKKGAILEQMVKEADSEKKEEIMKLMYSYVQFLCIYDTATAEYNCRVKEYDEEQLLILQKAPLLKNYIDTVNAIYNEKNYEDADKFLTEIEKICPGLSTTMFLEGVMAFDNLDYERAEKAFMDCIKINDSNYAAIYSLAVIYDACEEYEKSYQMCKQAKEKMITIDHGIDWYGIGAHIDYLMSQLEKYVEI